MLRKTITALAMTATVVLLATGTAQAADGVLTPSGAGGAYWTENGDKLEVCDYRADGWGVRGYIYVPNAPDSATGNVLIKADDPSFDGMDNCVPASKNISESGHISIKVCLYKGTSTRDCAHTRLR